MIRKAFVMKLKAGCADEYRSRHDPIWPELKEVLSRHGVRNYSIFLEAETDRLFGYALIVSELEWQRIAATEICRRWWTYMEGLMETNPDESPVVIDLVEVFHMD